LDFPWGESYGFGAMKNQFPKVCAGCFSVLALALSVALGNAGCRTSDVVVSSGVRAGLAGGSSKAVASGSEGERSSAAGSAGSVSLPPHVGAWRITPLGDSITGSTCAPQLLSKALSDHGKTNFTFVGSNLNAQSCNGAGAVRTEGHGGYLVTDLVGTGQHASELPKWCESNQADLVLMQFGTNDVWNDRSPSAILAAYSTVLSELRAAKANVIVLLAQIPPLNPAGCPACESRVVALNSRIPSWASQSSTVGSPVLVVDLHSAFTAASYLPNSAYTADGVHPNLLGAQLIADKWYAALIALGAP
jgi:lysophospholipase L1-like esterase